MNRRPASRVLALITLATLAGGCARVGLSGPGTPAGSKSSFDARAADVAAAWHHSGAAASWRHGFVPLQDLTVVGNPGFNDTTKIAFINGDLALDVDPPAGPARGRVTFPDGSTMDVPLVGARDAFRAMATGTPSCPKVDVPPSSPGTDAPSDSPSDGVTGIVTGVGCAVLHVSEITFGTTTLFTSRGEATVPAWLFIIEGLTSPIARVAVAPAAVTAAPSGEPTGVALPGIAGGYDLAAVADRQVTFRITIGSCDTVAGALVYEDASTVVVGASYSSTDGLCDAMAHIVPEKVSLARPLGDRVVLDVITGVPLAIRDLP